MKKIILTIFLINSIILFSYQIKIDYIENKNIIKITNASTYVEIYKNNQKTDYKITFKDINFENKEYILPKGPIKRINQYDNILEIKTIFPADIEIKNNLEIIVYGKKPLNNDIFQFKKIKIKDLLDLILKEFNYNAYYLTPIPDKEISLTLKDFYPEDLFRIIFDSTGLYYHYISTKDIYISKNPLYNLNYPIINSSEIKTEETYELIQTNIPNIQSLANLINLQYVNLYNELYILKGQKEKIELIKKIISNIPKTDTPATTTSIENKIYKIFEYKLPKKDIIKSFNIQYSEISKELLLLEGFEKDLEIFEQYYNQAYQIYNKKEIITNPKPIETKEPTITIINTKLPIEKLSNILNLNINKFSEGIYIVKGENIEILNNIISKIPQEFENKINQKDNPNNKKNNEKIKIISSNLDLFPFNKIFKNIIIQKIEKNYIIKGPENEINTIIEFNEKYGQTKQATEIKKLTETNESSKTTQTVSQTHTYFFTIKNEEDEYLKSITQKLNITYEILFENEEGKIIKIESSENEYLKLKELISLKESIVKKEITEYKSLYQIMEEYAEANNFALLNNEKLKSINIYNLKNIKENIEEILLKNGFYLEKEKNVIIVNEKMPKIISIEIAIVDSSILEETIQKIESKFSSKDIIDSINQGIITPQIYKDILDTAFEMDNRNSKSNSRLVSKPKIILKSGTKSMFKSVYRVPVIQENSIKYIESGLNLEIEANYIENQNLIDLDINLKVGEPEKSAVSSYNAENSREINTKMILKNDYVSILGGLKIIKEENLNSGIPLLKDLPIIGFIFKNTELRNREYNLNLFIWPKLVNYGGD
ncbi:hypothetical protein JCM30566_09040 [Marinitoga arctica]